MTIQAMRQFQPSPMPWHRSERRRSISFFSMALPEVEFLEMDVAERDALLGELCFERFGHGERAAQVDVPVGDGACERGDNFLGGEAAVPRRNVERRPEPRMLLGGGGELVPEQR